MDLLPWLDAFARRLTELDSGLSTAAAERNALRAWYTSEPPFRLSHPVEAAGLWHFGTVAGHGDERPDTVAGY